MKTNRNLSELFRGEWLIHNPEMYLTLIHTLLKDKKFSFTSNYEVNEQMLNFYDKNNKLIGVDSNGMVTENSIASVTLRGEIFPYSDWCTIGAEDIVNQLYQAQEMKNVDATIFEINSPGGSTQGADFFSEFKRNKTKPVVGLVKDALSLGYLAAVECCDYIIADGNLSPRIGSIGVVATLVDNRKYLETIGIEVKEFYPPESKDKNKDIIDALDGKPEGLFKNSLSPLAVIFQNIVIDGRPNLKQEDGVLNGKVYMADEALRLGLIDGIGDRRTAIAKARELALKNSISKF